MIRYVTLLFCIGFSSYLAAQLVVSANIYAIRGGEQDYAEVAVGLQSKTLTYVDGLGQLDYIIAIKDGERYTHAEKYSITVNASNKDKDLWDVKRFALKPNDKFLEVQLIDTNTSDTTKLSKRISLSPRGSLSLSDPMLCSGIGNQGDFPLDKYGVGYEPLAFNLIGPQTDKLNFIASVHDVQVSEPVLLKFAIGREIYNPSMPEEPISVGYERLLEDGTNVVVKSIKIDNLSSGDYHLFLEVIDAKKQSKCRKIANFQILRPISDFTQLAENDAAFENSFVHRLTDSEVDYGLRAISSQIDRTRTEILNGILADGTSRTKRYFLYAFWQEYSPQYPRQAYLKYMEVAQAVDRQFGNAVGRGFETDRGFYYLKYGRPNQVIREEHESSAPPYEIWIYNKLDITGETNVKFLFYNPSLSGNDYQILHTSSKYDVNNPDWQRVLYKNAPNQINGNPIQSGQIQENYNRNAVRYFEEN